MQAVLQARFVIVFMFQQHGGFKGRALSAQHVNVNKLNVNRRVYATNSIIAPARQPGSCYRVTSANYGYRHGAGQTNNAHKFR